MFVSQHNGTRHEWNEWMMHLYSALLCIVVHPKCFTVMLSHSWLIQQIQYSEVLEEQIPYFCCAIDLFDML